MEKWTVVQRKAKQNSRCALNYLAIACKALVTLIDDNFTKALIMPWIGMVWCGMVEFGMVWCGMIEFCILLYERLWYGIVLYGMA